MGKVRGYTTQAGERRYIARETRDGVDYSAAASTERAAIRKLQERMAAGKKAPPAPKTLTLAVFMEAWLTEGETHWAASTARANRMHYEKYIKGPLGRYTFPQLTLDVVQKWLNSLATTDRKHRCRKLLHWAWQDAMDKAILDLDPYERLNLPKRERRRARYWTDTQWQMFMAQDMEEHYRVYFTLALAWPTRPGEILGTRWGSIDLGRGTWHIQESRSMYADKATPGPLKTTDSDRVATLSDGVVAILRAWKGHQDVLRATMGRAWAGEDYVCTNADGRPLAHPAAYKVLRTRAIRAGLPAISLYQLRHTVISSMGRAGMPIEVAAAAAGHANSQITQQIYRQIHPDELRRAAQAWRARLAEAADLE